MEPRGPAADELREVAERSRGVIDELRVFTRQATDARHASVEQLGIESARIAESLAAEIATELTGDIARQHDEQLTAARAQLDEKRAKLNAEREAWVAERTEWEAVRDQIENDLAGLEADLKAEKARLEAQRLDTEIKSQAKADQLLAEANEALLSTEQQAAEAHETIASLTQTLNEADAQLTAAAEAEAEHATLQEKFELVLADLQSHRERVAELDQQLAERPESDGSQDAELTALRMERDELQRQLDESTDASHAAPTDADTEELRARFELAVEDVRRLKNENADLRERASSGDTSSDDENGWEAQKRRLLASLEDEGDSDDPDRAAEQATIAGTVQITDEVIAGKDQEIEDLRSQLEASTSGAMSAENHAVSAALLDEDEVIQAERARLAQLETEWQEKLRSAELELSVERAKITRTQSELAEQQIELETLRAAVSAGAGDIPGEHRRNWMNKLGLGADES